MISFVSVNLALLFGVMFLWGLVRGSSSCAVCCSPGMIPYIAVKRLPMREGLRLAAIFNLPRVLLLTALGAVIGMASFSILHTQWFRSITGVTGVLGYLLAGVFLLGLGLHMATHSASELRNTSASSCKGKTIKGSRWSSVLKGCSSDSALFMFWGALMSLSCAVEMGLIEGIAFTGTIGSIMDTPALASLWGAGMLMTFALGTSVPVIGTAAVGSLIGKRYNAKALARVKSIGTVLMIFIGAVLVLVDGYGLYIRLGAF